MSALPFHGWVDAQEKALDKHAQDGGDPALFWAGRMSIYAQRTIEAPVVACYEWARMLGHSVQEYNLVIFQQLEDSGKKGADDGE